MGRHGGNPKAACRQVKPGGGPNLPREMTGAGTHYGPPPSNANPALPSRTSDVNSTQPTAKETRPPEDSCGASDLDKLRSETPGSAARLSTPIPRFGYRAPSCLLAARLLQVDPSTTPGKHSIPGPRFEPAGQSDPVACAEVRTEV